MNILFVCKGNILRSIIAETYLRSKNITNVNVTSRGTAASKYKNENKQNITEIKTMLASNGLSKYTKDNFAEELRSEEIIKADLTVFMSPTIEEEAFNLGFTPADYITWDIVDIGDPGRDKDVKNNKQKYRADTFSEITSCVDKLIDQQQLLKG